MVGPAVAPVVQAWTARPTAPTGFMVAPGETHENPQFYRRDLVVAGEANVYREELVWSGHGGNRIPRGMGGGGLRRGALLWFLFKFGKIYNHHK